MSIDERPQPYFVLRQLLLDARRTAGIKQAELAAKLGKPQSYVYKVETGERQLDVIEFVAYAGGLGLHPVAVIADLVMRLQQPGSE